ncbi:hypothetical protein IKE_05728 [Bacillus cereus VD196]|uniref:Uncharacterized protein n=1 Tax=Bacillus cereus VD196 TaxID=1053243 RepID=A0A9W5V637_BACCE|nr:hypothetical protein IKG_05814 [Bacillus cereus VD200]EOO62301.1 hypothetical protein IKE_05728 [Bacillus cereus VD196]
MGYFKGNNYDFIVTPPHEKGVTIFYKPSIHTGYIDG